MRKQMLGVGIVLLSGLFAIVANAATKEAEVSIDKAQAKVKATKDAERANREVKAAKDEDEDDDDDDANVAKNAEKIKKESKGETKVAKAAKEEDDDEDDDAKPVKKAEKVKKGAKVEQKNSKAAKEEDEDDDDDDAKPEKKAAQSDKKAAQPDKKAAQPEKSDAKLNAAAEKTFKRVFPKAKIEKLDVEVENGVTVYDIEFNNGPVEREVDIAADGTLLETTLVIDEQELPLAVLKAFKKGTEGAEFGRIEKITIRYQTKDGKVVKLPGAVIHYSVEYVKGNQPAEITVNRDGSDAPE